MIISEDIRIALTQKLHLINAIDSQDWELEVADPKRITEFLKSLQNDVSLTDKMKRALIIVCISSYNDYLDKYHRNMSIESQLVELLKDDIELLKDLYQYWDIFGDEHDTFNVYTFLKEIACR